MKAIIILWSVILILEIAGAWYLYSIDYYPNAMIGSFFAGMAVGILIKEIKDHEKTSKEIR